MNIFSTAISYKNIATPVKLVYRKPHDITHFHKMSHHNAQLENKLEKKNRFTSEGPIRKNPTPTSDRRHWTQFTKAFMKCVIPMNGQCSWSERSASWKPQNEQYIKKILLFIRSGWSSGPSRILDISKYFFIHASPFICFFGVFFFLLFFISKN